MYHVVRIDNSKDYTKDVTAILGTIKKCKTAEAAKKIAKKENDKISNQCMNWIYKVIAA